MMEDARSVQETPDVSMLAIFSLIFAILAWTLLPFLGMAMVRWNLFNFITLPVAGSVIASASARVALRKIQKAKGSLRGAGFAKAAQLLAVTQCTLVALLFIFIVVQSFFRSQQTF